MLKQKLGIIAALILLLPVLSLADSSNPWEKKLPFKAATIHYTLSGMEIGTETLYIRDYGRESATHRSGKSTMMGMTSMVETVDIESPDWVYSFDLTARTGTKSANPKKYMIEEYNRLSAAEKKQVAENVTKIGLPVTESLGAKVEQKVAKILGYDCDRIQMMGTTVYSMHEVGIPLKMETNMMGVQMKQEATKVDEGAVSQKYFDLPQGIEVVADPQTDAMARSMAQQTLATLKSPDGAKKMQEQTAGNPMMPQGAGLQQMSPEEKQEMEQAMQMLKGMMGGQK